MRCVQACYQADLAEVLTRSPCLQCGGDILSHRRPFSRGPGAEECKPSQAIIRTLMRHIWHDNKPLNRSSLGGKRGLTLCVCNTVLSGNRGSCHASSDMLKAAATPRDLEASGPVTCQAGSLGPRLDGARPVRCSRPPPAPGPTALGPAQAISRSPASPTHTPTGSPQRRCLTV
ncbi:unnamed protein product [Boreogadus saida]